MNTKHLQQLILDREDAKILLDLLERELKKEFDNYDEEQGETVYMEKLADIKEEVEEIYLFLS